MANHVHLLITSRAPPSATRRTPVWRRRRTFRGWASSRLTSAAVFQPVVMGLRSTKGDENPAEVPDAIVRGFLFAVGHARPLRPIGNRPQVAGRCRPANPPHMAARRFSTVPHTPRLKCRKSAARSGNRAAGQGALRLKSSRRCDGGSSCPGPSCCAARASWKVAAFRTSAAA